MKKSFAVLVVLLVIVIVVIILKPFYVLDEGEQAVVIRFGKIVSAETDAGLHLKTPMVDTVKRYPKKILSWDGDEQRIPTEEKQFIRVDTTARWLISDPKLFYESVTTMEGAYLKLDDIIDSSVRTVIAQNPLYEAVRNSNVIFEIDRSTTASSEADIADTSDGQGEATETKNISDREIVNLLAEETSSQNISTVQKGRSTLSDEMLNAAASKTLNLGIELIDIVIRQIRYSEELTESVYNRMIKERNQIAQLYRANGEGEKKDLLGSLEKEQKQILSEAYSESQSIMGAADATATQIYAQAYEVDPDFFQFWRSIESYRKTLPQFEKTLTTDMEYFQYLFSQDGR